MYTNTIIENLTNSGIYYEAGTAGHRFYGNVHTTGSINVSGSQTINGNLTVTSSLCVPSATQQNLNNVGA